MDHLLTRDLLTLTFIPISILLAGAIIVSGQAKKRWMAWPLLASALALFMVNEWAIRSYYPQYNIRVDLIILSPLALIAVSRLAFPRIDDSSLSQVDESSLSQADESSSSRVDESSLSPAGKLARRALSFSLINLPFWMLPILSIPGVISGHKALRLGVHGDDLVKAFIGLLLGYGEIIAAAALWLSMLE